MLASSAAEGIAQAAVEAALGEVGKIGFKKAMQNKWVVLDKTSKLVRAVVDRCEDSARVQLEVVAAWPGGDQAEQRLGKKTLEVKFYVSILYIYTYTYYIYI